MGALHIAMFAAFATATTIGAAAPAASAKRGQSTNGASAVLQRAADTMGVNALSTVRWSDEGVGWTYGQSFTPGAPWPKIAIHSRKRTIDYVNGSMREEITLSRAEPKGGGGYPPSAQQTNDQYIGWAERSASTRPGSKPVREPFAWNHTAAGAQPGPRFVNDRIHQLWVTPHGAIRSALRNKATLIGGGANGRGPAMVAFTEPGRFAAMVFINADNVVERVQTRIPDNVTGETMAMTSYTGYRQHGAVRFPSRIEQAIGGHPTLDVRVTAVEPNPSVAIAVPDAVRNATERVTADKVDDGVWFLAGGTHNSVAIAMRDYMILVEAPLNDSRTIPVVEKTLELGSGKPIRYVINSHQHFDHSGGVRMASTVGATVLTHARNVEWYRNAFATPNTIAPDVLARSGRTPRVFGIGERVVIHDDDRSVELLPIADSVHNDGFLMVWLPKERLLIEGDAYTPGPPNAPPPSTPNPNHVNLVDNIERLGLDVGRILPLHGRIANADELYVAAAKPRRR